MGKVNQFIRSEKVIEIMGEFDEILEGNCKGCERYSSHREGDQRYCIDKCPIGKKLSETGGKLERLNGNTMQKLYNKGKEMKLTEVSLLLDSGYSREKLRKKLGVRQEDTKTFFDAIQDTFKFS